MPPRLCAAALAFAFTAGSDAFVIRPGKRLAAGATQRARSRSIMQMKTGIFFASISGSSEDVADRIKEQLGDDVEGPFDVQDDEIFSVEKLLEYDSLIVGLPTYNTGAEKERSGTEWDDLYYDPMADMDFSGKKVACFGVGDAEGYGDTFCEALGEIHDVFESKGAALFGYTDASAEAGYEHEASRSEVDGKFVGLVCDMVNQEELTDGRVQSWCAQLKAEGFFMAGGAATPVAAVQAVPEATSASIEDALAELIEPEVAVASDVAEAMEHEAAKYPGWTPYYSSKLGQTLWVNMDDHTKSFYTFHTKAK